MSACMKGSIQFFDQFLLVFWSEIYPQTSSKYIKVVIRICATISWNLSSLQGVDCERHGLASEVWRSDSLTWHRSRILELPLSGPLDSRMAGHIVCYFSTNAFCFVPWPLYIRNLNYLAGSNSTSRKAHPEFGASL